jgi:hypothetical protein
LNYLLDCTNNKELSEILITELHPETSNLYKLNLKKNEVLIKEILSNNSKYYEDKMNISLALLLQDYTIYHPLFLD